MPSLIDTNDLIYALHGKAIGPAMSLIEGALLDEARLSVVTRMEILGWRGHTTESRNEAEKLLKLLREVPLHEAVISTVIQLRSRIAIKLPDAIIAASALVENLPLITRNARDFKHIPGLTVIDPFAA